MRDLEADQCFPVFSDLPGGGVDEQAVGVFAEKLRTSFAEDFGKESYFSFCLETTSVDVAFRVELYIVLLAGVVPL